MNLRNPPLFVLGLASDYQDSDLYTLTTTVTTQCSFGAEDVDREGNEEEE